MSRFAHTPWRFAHRAVLYERDGLSERGSDGLPRPGVLRSGAWAVAGEEVVMGDGQTLRRRALAGAVIAVVMLVLPSMAWGQAPSADRFQKVVLDDTPGEPMNL